MPYLIKLLSVFLLATVKFFYAPLYAYLIGLQPVETAISMVSGGLLGFVFFYYISYFIIISTRYLKPVADRVAPGSLKNKYNRWREKRNTRLQNRSLFNRRNRMMVRIRTLGMWAIIITTPFLLSIPLGAFLLRKYYGHRRGKVWFALVTIAAEGILLCWLIWNVPELRP